MKCKIAYFASDDGEYQTVLREECLATARRQGFPVQVFNAERDSHRQARQIEACLAQPPEARPTVVVVVPVSEVTLRHSGTAAARLGVAWVMLLRWDGHLNELRAQFPQVPIFSVFADQHEIGRIQGQQMRALLPRGGEAVFIRGPLGTSSAMRRFEGFQEVLKGSRIELSLLDCDFSFAGGERVMSEQTQILQRMTTKKFVVGAQNDAMAMGARRAIEVGAGWRKGFSPDSIAFCGIDGTPSYGQRLVLERQLTSTVIMPPSGGRAILEIAAFLRGGPRPPASIVLRPTGFPEAPQLRQLPSWRPAPTQRRAGKSGA